MKFFESLNKFNNKTFLNKNLGSAHRHTGFTLSEVVITLGIIGVVAAMTIPTVLQNQREKETVAKLKKAYSTLSNAYTLAVQENGTPENWDLVATASQVGANNALQKIVPYLNVTKNCGTASGCFPNVIYKHLRGTDQWNMRTEGSIARASLADGSLLALRIQNPTCSRVIGTTLQLQNICAGFYYDLNGSKSPNQYGIDIFNFNISKYGIIPTGVADQTLDDTFGGDCKDKSTGLGHGCAAWVLYNENMDYLHCSDLSWTGKTQCD